VLLTVRRVTLAIQARAARECARRPALESVPLVGTRAARQFELTAKLTKPSSAVETLATDELGLCIEWAFGLFVLTRNYS
jgi:hypothetical protein